MIILSELAKEKNGEQRIEIQTIILTIFKTPGQSEEMFKSWGCLTRLNHVNSFGPFLHWLSGELCEMFILNIPVLLVLKIYAITCKVTETNWIGVWAKSYFTMIQRCLKTRTQKLKSRITRVLQYRHAFVSSRSPPQINKGEWQLMGQKNAVRLILTREEVWRGGRGGGGGAGLEERVMNQKNAVVGRGYLFSV